MSIVACQTRVNESEVDALKFNADRFRELAEMSWDLKVSVEKTLANVCS